jgi:chromosome segregation ATPase
MDNQNNDIMTLRDLQEIKSTLKSFSENAITQLQLLREAMSQSVSQKATISKNVDEIEYLLKSFKRNLEDYERKLTDIMESVDNLENKIIDRNNQEALAVSIDILKKSLSEISNIVKGYDITHAYSKEERKTLDDKLIDIEKSINGFSQELKNIRDVKKNLSWWVDWIYKVLLTIGVIYGLFNLQ